MGGIFGGGAPKVKPQPIQAPKPVPTIDDAKESTEQSDMLRRRQGRAATLLTGPQGDMVAPTVGTKTLLGA